MFIKGLGMKKYLFIAGILITQAQMAFCATGSANDLQSSLKQTSGEPGFLSVIFSLLVVVLLIYVTGLIYSKLNVIGTQKVREQLANHDLQKAIVISTTQLGQNKNLHVIELNKKHYLIGATANSISLIKELTLPEIHKNVVMEEVVEEPADIDDAIRVLYTGKRSELAAVPEEEEQEEEFEVHKKYL